MASNVVYPTLTIDGVTYEIKFSRKAIYRLDRAGFDMASIPKKLRPNESGQIMFGPAMLVDLLHATISDRFPGTAEDLAELVLADQDMKNKAATALLEAFLKIQPSGPQAIREPAAKPTPDQPEPLQ